MNFDPRLHLNSQSSTPNEDQDSFRRPPPPHDPRDRELVARVENWEVRIFSPQDPKHAYFVPKGFLHLQFWHPEKGISVLSPSLLTASQFEVFPIDGWKKPALCYCQARNLIYQAFGELLPPKSVAIELMRWYVGRYEVLQKQSPLNN